MELDVSQLATTDFNKSKIIVLKAGRIEITDPETVEALKDFIHNFPKGEIAGMDDAQKGFYLFNKIFQSGLLPES